MLAPLRIVQYGLGPIGLATAATVLRKQASGLIELVGAVDIDPAKVGRDVGTLLGAGEPSGVIVSSDARRVLAETAPHVVLHTTSSFLDKVKDQLMLCVTEGVHVVSSTEELAYPYERHPELAVQLDLLARDCGKVIIGTGINPGFVMDTLVLTATAACTDVTRVYAERVVDAGARREPLQRKVGAGLSLEAFEEKKQTGTFGHIGLRESLFLIADGLGWLHFDAVEERLEPVLAERDVRTPFLQVPRGMVAGIHQVVTGYRGAAPVLTLELKMYVGAEASYDRVHVEGTPPVDLLIRGGIFGDTATSAVLVNVAPLVLQAPPGLRTMKDLLLPRAFAALP